MPSLFDAPDTPPILSSVGLFLGIDPGASGGLACIAADGITVVKMPDTDRDLWDWFRWYEPGMKPYAMIEQQIPRPTIIKDHKTGIFRPTILKSTCLLYGNYTRLCGMLIAAEIPYEAITPQRWQKALHISPREKGEPESRWKNRLKAKAQQLYPSVNITLAVSDALLIATYCKRRQEGTL